MSARNVITGACLIAVLLSAVLIRLPLLSIPLERDEGAYAYVAWRMSFGEVPYRDVFDHKPPLVYVLYWLALKLSGPSPWGIHLFAALYNAASVCVLFLLVSRLQDRWTGLIAAAAFAVISTAPAYHGHAANTELFMLLPMLAAALLLWLALKAPSSAGLVFLSGVAGGLAALLKQSALPVLLFLVVAVVVQRGWLERRLKSLALELAMLLLGVAAPLAATLGAFAALNALGAFYDALIAYNAEYAAAVTASGSRDLLAGVLRDGWPSQALFWLLAVVGLAIVLARRRRGDWFLLGFFVASAGAVAMGGWFLPHYFVQMLPAVAGVAAVSVRALGGSRAWGQSAGLRAAACIGIGLACAALAFWGDSWYWFAPSSETLVRRIYGSNPFEQSAALAAYLSERTKPDEKVFILGSEPQVLVLAKRATASRYPYIYPLTQATAGAAERQREAAESIEREPPAYAVVVIFDRSLVIRPKAPRELFDRLAALIRRSYYLDAFTAPAPEGTVWVKGRQAVLACKSRVPHTEQILLFRRRAPGETFPDVRDDWSFTF